MRPINLDHNATTPVDPDVLAAMLPFLREDFGNPSSAPAAGRRAHDAVETARAEVAALIGARADEIIHAQNEVGTLQPLAEIARAAHAKGALMHADAAQSVGKAPVDVAALGLDLLTVAGHKLYAPKGIGVLYMRRGLDLPPLIVGAGQEHGRRPGTENVAGIVALGEACRLARLRLERGTQELAALARDLLARLQREVPGLVLVGHPTDRLPNTLNVLFPGVSGRRVLDACPGVLASTGSACHADREDPSSILLALGIDPQAALGAVRLSLGYATTRDDIETAARRLGEAWRAVARVPANAT